MADNTTDLSTLAAEYTDKLANDLVLAPDPELPLAKMAYSAAVLAEMAEGNPGDFDIVSQQMAMLASAQSGVAANMVEAMAGGGAGSLILSNNLVFPGLVTMVKEAKGDGDNIKINRPRYLDDVVPAGGGARFLSPSSKLFGNSQPLTMDQIAVQVRESSGPGDSTGATVPISISLFAQERARHDQLTNARLQLRRSRWRWVHYMLQGYILGGTNVTYPSGVSADSGFSGAGNEPIAYEMFPRLESALETRNIPGIGGAVMYVVFLTPYGIAQLKTDPAYQRQAEFHPEFNVLFPGYVKTVGNLIVCKLNTIPTLTGGIGGAVTIYQGFVVAPQALGWALGQDAQLRRDKNDDGGRFLRAAWTAIEGFALLNNDFIQVIHHT